MPFTLKRVIEKLGNHQVDSVYHEKLTGIDDKSLNQICYKEKRILITLDSDFISIPDPFYGIIILRSKTQGKSAVSSLFEIFLDNFSLKAIVGKIIIIEPDLIRIRY